MKPWYLPAALPALSTTPERGQAARKTDSMSRRAQHRRARQDIIGGRVILSSMVPETTDTDDSTDTEEDGLWYPCWFCGTQAAAPSAFSVEFDTPFHLHCAHAEGVADADDPILAYEERRFEEHSAA